MSGYEENYSNWSCNYSELEMLLEILPDAVTLSALTDLMCIIWRDTCSSDQKSKISIFQVILED